MQTIDEQIEVYTKFFQGLSNSMDGNTDKICTCEILKNEKYTENKEG